MKKLLIALALMGSPAAAHEWYDAACCSGHDCAPAPAGSVTITSEGYRVRVEPGEHPMIPADGPAFETFAPFVKAPDDYWSATILPSRDGRFHLCIVPDTGLRCLYVPLGV